MSGRLTRIGVLLADSCLVAKLASRHLTSTASVSRSPRGPARVVSSLMSNVALTLVLRPGGWTEARRIPGNCAQAGGRERDRCRPRMPIVQRGSALAMRDNHS